MVQMSATICCCLPDLGGFGAAFGNAFGAGFGGNSNNNNGNNGGATVYGFSNPGFTGPYTFGPGFYGNRCRSQARR